MTRLALLPCRPSLRAYPARRGGMKSWLEPMWHAGKTATLFTLLTWSLANAQEDPPEAQGIPSWVIIGIAKVETQSYWEDGRFVYVDKRDGTSGERGAFQLTAGAFAQVRRAGESFARVRRDPGFALSLTARYLWVLYRASGSWDRAVGCYNTGLGGSPSRGAQYLLLVKIAAGITP